MIFKVKRVSDAGRDEPSKPCEHAIISEDGWGWIVELNTITEFMTWAEQLPHKVVFEHGGGLEIPTLTIADASLQL